MPIVRQHLEVNRRVLVAGEADEAHLAVTLRPVQRLDGAIARKVMFRIVVVDAFVNLPEVEEVGLQPLQ
jgi:hypothetical protein